MSKKKAMEFLKFLESNKEFQEKMSGFTPEELEEAQTEMFGELPDSTLNSIAGGKPNPFARNEDSFLDFFRKRK